MSHDPSRDVRMLRSSTLILGLLDPFQHGEPSIARTRSKKSLYSASEIENVQRDQIGPSTDILLVGHKEIRQREFPLGRSQSNEQVGEGNLPYGPTAQSTNIMKQVGMRILVVATTELDTNKVC